MLTYRYPGAICLSVDDEIVHGIPGRRRLRSGQLLTIDVAAELDGFHADAATTITIGPPTPAGLRLIAAGRAALQAGIKAAQPGRPCATSAQRSSARPRSAASAWRGS